MKKILVILAVAGFLIACNNSAESKPGDKDSNEAPPSADTITKMKDEPANHMMSPDSEGTKRLPRQ